MNKKYDFGIIGAGPAGYTAAIRAAQLGKTVVLFEKQSLGGVCLNKGCIPTKTFLHCADVYNLIKKASNLGIEIENYSINFEKAAERKEKTIEKLRKSLEMLLNSYGIEIVMAEAKIVDEGTGNREQKTEEVKSKKQKAKSNVIIDEERVLEVCHCEEGQSPDAAIQKSLSAFQPSHFSLIHANGETYECEHVLIATGSEPKCVGGFEFDHEFILSSDDVLELKTLPQKVLIVGSGAIGIEWARIFSAFGTEVTVVEIADKLLPLADIDVSSRLERIFKMARIKTFLSTSVKEIKNKIVTLSNGEILEPDFVLFATGRKPFINGIITPLYLIGDAYGSIQLAHFASHQGIQVVENIVLGKEVKEFITPSVVYGNPEIAWAGKTEQEPGENEYKKSVFPISALGKAHADGDMEGFVKILTDKKGKILGAHIIAKEASAMIHQLSIAMENGLNVEDLKHCCFAHPTYSEGVFESLLGLDNQSLSLLKENRA
ncbi:MAG: FAD-dependent oxidoreductase [Candidatus Gastranaerophilales bacterium]|nr:FAD-dependent oxidoreductase [Candidatus Gastranaerophilales bacterium]